MNEIRSSGSAKPGSQTGDGDEAPAVFHSATPGRRPETDAGYLELLSLTLFTTAVGDREALTAQWPDIVFGFKNFHVQRVAEFSEGDLQDVALRIPALKDKPELRAVVANAAAMTQISRVYGSFRKYLRSFEKDGQAELLKDMAVRFMMLEGTTGEEFLKAVGEKVRTPEQEQPAPQRQGQRRGQQQRQPRAGAQPEASRPQQGRANGQRQQRGQQGGGDKGNAQGRNRDGRRRRFHWRKKKPAGASGAPTEAAATAKSA